MYEHLAWSLPSTCLASVCPTPYIYNKAQRWRRSQSRVANPTTLASHDFGYSSARCNSKQLNNKQIEEAKDNAEQRWKVAKGQYKKVLASSKEVRSKSKMARNRIGYSEAEIKIEQNKSKRIEEAKAIAEQRWKVSKGQYKKVLASSKEVRSELKMAKNRIGYLEKLLAFEERSGFSTISKLKRQKTILSSAGRWLKANSRRCAAHPTACVPS